MDRKRETEKREGLNLNSLLEFEMSSGGLELVAGQDIWPAVEGVQEASSLVEVLEVKELGNLVENGNGVVGGGRGAG
jgi:hypothetical protein